MAAMAAITSITTCLVYYLPRPDPHNSVLLYYSLPQKCGTLQQKYVPENLVHFIYVPDVPVIWYKSGTKTRPPQDGQIFG